MITKEQFNVGQIARICHETNRAYCESIGDTSQFKWEDAPEWQKNSAVDGVKFHIDQHIRGIKPLASASHDSWLVAKEKDGWKYGPVKDADKKEHPCFVSYEQLPLDQQMKDYLFGAVVEAFVEAHR